MDKRQSQSQLIFLTQSVETGEIHISTLGRKPNIFQEEINGILRDSSKQLVLKLSISKGQNVDVKRISNQRQAK